MTIANIESLARLLTNTNTTSYTAANLLIAENAAYERIVGKIISETAGSRWQFGDINYGAFPTYTINLVDGTQTYSLTDLSTTPLTIMGIEVLDENGNPHLLDRVSLKEIHDSKTAFDDYYSTNGLPAEFELRDGEIVLYPAPASANVTTTNGLIVYYLRTADIFTSGEQSTGTKEPGFPSPWHDILAYEAAYVYAVANNLPNKNFLKAEVDRKEKELLDFISRRDQNDVENLTTNIKSFR